MCFRMQNARKEAPEGAVGVFSHAKCSPGKPVGGPLQGRPGKRRRPSFACTALPREAPGAAAGVFSRARGPPGSPSGGASWHFEGSRLREIDPVGSLPREITPARSPLREILPVEPAARNLVAGGTSGRFFRPQEASGIFRQRPVEIPTGVISRQGLPHEDASPAHFPGGAPGRRISWRRLFSMKKRRGRIFTCKMLRREPLGGVR